MFSFFSKNLFEKPGVRLVDNTEGVDLTQFLEPGLCREHLPWGVHRVNNVEIGNRVLYLCKSRYASGYDPTIRMPLWTSEVLNASMLEHLAIGETAGQFIENQKLPSGMRLNRSDFNNPYFIPGQMASPENMFTNIKGLNNVQRKERLRKVMDESFLLSNTAPMVAVNMRNGLWFELEKQIKRWLVNKGELFVVSGPLFLNGKNNGLMGVNKIPIPTHFYKIVIYPRNHGSVAYIIPNKEIRTQNTIEIINLNNTHSCPQNQNGWCSLNDFIVPLTEVERISGITFFSELAPHFAARIRPNKN